MEQTVENKRATDRVVPSQATVTIFANGLEPMQAGLLDESFGGLGILVPTGTKLGKEIDVELSAALGGISSVALVRHVRPTKDGDRVGLEWKALALSRCLRELLQAEQSSVKHQSLSRILPGGLSVMWKLYEGGRWQHIVDSADRLKKEAAACRVNDLREPIELFQKDLQVAIESDDNVKEKVRFELDRLILKCIEAIS